MKIFSNGIRITKKRDMYSVEDIMKITNKGRTYCYSLIKKLQEELKSQGKIVISGRIPKEYFDKKVLGK